MVLLAADISEPSSTRTLHGFVSYENRKTLEPENVENDLQYFQEWTACMRYNLIIYLKYSRLKITKSVTI